MHTDRQEYRKRIERQIGRRIPTKVWRSLVWDGRVDDAIEGSSAYGDGDFIDDVEFLQRFEAILNPPRESEESTPVTSARSSAVRMQISGAGETAALDAIMKIEASGIPEVERFRQEMLQGELIAGCELETWLESCAADDLGMVDRAPQGENTAFRPEFLTSDGLPYLPEWPNRRVPDARFVEYPNQHNDPNPDETPRIPLPPDGLLLRLKETASSLMLRYPWSEAQAVEFILTGSCDAIPAAIVTLYHRHPRRIALDVDPGLTAEQVAGQYRDAQRSLLNLADGRYSRPQREKHLSLAVFRASGRRGTWSEMMERWNSNCGQDDWRYGNVRLFQRDCEKALSRLRRRRMSGDGSIELEAWFIHSSALNDL